MTRPKISPAPISLLTRVSSFIFVILVLILAQIGFAGYAILVKAFAFKSSTSPILFSLLRDVICLPVLGLLSLVLEGPTIPQKKDLLVFTALGFTGIFGNQIGFIVGVYSVGASIASIYQPSIPIWTLVLAFVFGLEPLKLKTLWIKVLGIILVVGGAILMLVMSFTSGEKKNMLLGNASLLGNCISMAIYILIQKRFFFTAADAGEAGDGDAGVDVVDGSEIGADFSPDDDAPVEVDQLNSPSKSLSFTRHIWWWHRNKKNTTQKYPPLAVTFYAYAFGIVFMAIATLISFVFFDRTMFSSLQVQVLIPLLYSAIIQSCICYGLISYANSKVSSTVVTAVWPSQVPITILLSAIFFSETLEWNHYVGAVLICAGLLAVCAVKYLEEEYEERRKRRLKATPALNYSTQGEEDDFIVDHLAYQSDAQ